MAEMIRFYWRIVSLNAPHSPLRILVAASIVVVDAIRIKSSLEAYGQILRTVISDTMAGDNIGGGECVQSTM